MQDSPKRFLQALTSTTDSNAYLAAGAAVQRSEDPPDFLLKCLEEICIMNDPPSSLPRFIVGQLAAFLDKKGQPSIFESTELSKILDLALWLWRQPVAKGSAARLLKIWQVRGRHITTEQQRDEVAAMGTEILSLEQESNVTVITSFLSCFPEIAEDLQCGPETVFDNFCRKGWTAAAISLGKQFNMSNKVGELQHKRRLERIEAAAESEGKEIAAIQMCWRKPSLRPRLIRSLLNVGKVELAKMWIFAWRIKLAPSKQHLRLGTERARKFFQLPGRVKLHMISSPAELDFLTMQVTLGPWTSVGLDSESTFSGKLALLQVATESEVFLIDLVAITMKDVRTFLASKLRPGDMMLQEAG